MSFQKVLLFVFGLVLGLSECSYVDTLKKCKLHDNDCQKNGIQEMLKEVSIHGILELDIPSVDPYRMKTIHLSILEVIDFTLTEGTVEGIGTCVVERFDFNIEGLYATIELICDLTVKGKYKMNSTSDVIKSLLGQAIHGDGDGKVDVEKLKMVIGFPFKVEKRGDDTYLKGGTKDIKFSYEVLGTIKFEANNLYLGEKESSKEIIKIINENPKLIVASFGEHVGKVAIKMAHKLLNKFFDKTPTKHYIIDDLSSYV